MSSKIDRMNDDDLHLSNDEELARTVLYRNLREAEELDATGDKGISHQEMMKRLRERIK